MELQRSHISVCCHLVVIHGTPSISEQTLFKFNIDKLISPFAEDQLVGNEAG
jgi:hypothetical protein